MTNVRGAKRSSTRSNTTRPAAKRPRATARPETIDAYIAGFPPGVRPILERIRRTIRRAAPGAEERISYQMPAFRMEGVGIVAWFGGFKEHVGLYPPVRDPVLKRASARHAGPKGNLRFRFDEPIPYALIDRIVKSRVDARLGRRVERGTATRETASKRVTTSKRKTAARRKSASKGGRRR